MQGAMQGDVYKKRKSFFDLITSPFSFSDFSAKLDQADSSHIEVTNSASKDAVPILHGRLLHSRYDPKKEAARRFDILLKNKGHHLVVLQFDFLYGVEYWVEKKTASDEKTASDGEKKSKLDDHLLLVIQDWAMLDAFIIHRDWSFLSFFQSVEIIYLNDPKWQNWMEKIFARWCHQSFRGVIFFEKEKTDDDQGADDVQSDKKSSPSTLQQSTLQQSSLADFKKYLLQMVNNHFSNHLTRYVFEKKWLMNTFINLIAEKNYGFLNNLFSKNEMDEENLAVLVSSGPSVDEQIDELALLPMDQITLIAVDSAVPILSARGIVPDIVIAVDGGYYNALDLCYSPTVAKKKPLLFSSIFAHPLLLRYAKEQGYLDPYFFCLRKEDALWMDFQESEKSDEAFIFQSSSVTLIALDIIKKLNFKNVVAYGIDGCYSFFHGHASASTHDRYYIDRANRLHPREQGDFLSIVANTKKTEKKNEQEKYLYDIPSLNRFRNELSDYFLQEKNFPQKEKENKNFKLFIRSPYFPLKSISESLSHFERISFLKDGSKVLSMAKLSKKLKISDWVSTEVAKENVEKKSNPSDHLLNFFKAIDLFRKKLDQYRSVSEKQKHQLAKEIDTLIENKLAFIKPIVNHYRQLLAIKGDAVQESALSKKEKIYWEVLILFSRMQRYFSSILR